MSVQHKTEKLFPSKEGSVSGLIRTVLKMLQGPWFWLGACSYGVVWCGPQDTRYPSAPTS